MDLPRVVIVGGGFGGLYAAKDLGRARARITLVDRRNHHVFQPLLYQVATAALNPSDIASPIRAVLRNQANTTVLLAEVKSVDLAARRVQLDEGELEYDYLILAAGATHSYFGHSEWATFAPGLKSIEDALEIRRRILFAFEAAEREDDAAARAAWLTFAVVGAGPTGVEVAGALAEIARHTVARDFRRIDTRTARVILLEGGPRILPTYPEALSTKAAQQLGQLGVEVRVDTKVTGIDSHAVVLGTERLPARTTLWAAGVQASPLGRALGTECDRAGRVKVTPSLTVPGHDEVFVIGDLACASEGEHPIPGVAGAAVQGGRFAARQIARRLDGKPLETFHYVDKGSLATIGRKAAIADFGRVKLSGFLAWVAWLFIHILLLIGFRNRVLVFLEWAWAYFTYQRGARLITGPTPYGPRDERSQ